MRIHRTASSLTAALALVLTTAACEDDTPAGPIGSGYPADLIITVSAESGSVPPPYDSRETVTVGPEGLTYTAGSRYSDEPMFSRTIDAEEGDLDELMTHWEALDVPAVTGEEGDDSHSSGRVGGGYVIVTVTGTGYDSVAVGDEGPIVTLESAALALVPEDVRAEGLAVIEEYNLSDEG